MILRLVREQLRAHGRFVAWSTALLAVGMGLATFTLVIGATAFSSPAATADLFPSWREHGAVIASFDDAAPPLPKDYSFDQHMPVSQVEALLDEVANMPGVTAERGFPVAITNPHFDPANDYFDVGAYRTPVAWDDYLLTGSPPASGEIVVNADTADRLGIVLGDRLELRTPRTEGADARTMTFVVSGLSRRSATDSLGTYFFIPAGVISWDDSFEAERLLSQDGPWTMPDGTAPYTTVQIGWDGDNPTLAPYEDPLGGSTTWHFRLDANSLAVGAMAFPTPVALGVALILGLLGAAFGMGRAQGQIRTEWIATARVLGATKRTILASSVLEALVLGSAGLIVGFGGGLLGALAFQGYRRGAYPEVFIPPHLSIPAIVPVTVAALSFGIAAILASVPAFWATRVAPVAALKPVAPATSAPSSRSVSRWWPVGIALAGLVVALVAYHLDQVHYLTWGPYSTYEGGHPSGLALRLSATVAGVAGFAVLVDALRALVARLASRIARIPRAWAVAAGDGLASHARLHTFAAASFTILVGMVVAGVSPAAPPVLDGFNWQAWRESPLGTLRAYLDGRVWGSHWYGLLIPALIAAAIIAIGVTLSSRRVLAADSATRAALGLSRRAERIAAAVRQGAPMMLGIVVGAGVGWLLPLLARLAEAAVSDRLLVHGVTWNLQAAGYGFVAIGYAIAPALAIALVSSIVVGLTEGRGTPVDARRAAAGVRS